MAEIIKIFREDIPNLRFIGKRYADFGHWGEWWQNGWFDLLESAMGGTDKITALWENGGGYIGLERRGDGIFEYLIGMLTPIDTEVPDGFVSLDFCELAFGTCFIYGKESEVHDTSACRGEIEKLGLEVYRDGDGCVWSFENCTCPRYTTPDDKGNIILDYCYFVKK